MRLQPWVVKCFYYVNLYPALLQDAFKEDLEPKAYLRKTGVRSKPKDDTWDIDCPYNDPKRFKNVVDHIFD